jgi:hypothetical protein
MSWITILWAMMASSAATLAGICLVAWLAQRRNVTTPKAMLDDVRRQWTRLEYLSKAETPSGFSASLTHTRQSVYNLRG